MKRILYLLLATLAPTSPYRPPATTTISNPVHRARPPLTP
jgi:hypothetical protein